MNALPSGGKIETRAHCGLRRGQALIVGEASPMLVECQQRLASLGFEITNIDHGEAAIPWILAHHHSVELVLLHRRIPHTGATALLRILRALSHWCAVVMLHHCPDSDAAITRDALGLDGLVQVGSSPGAFTEVIERAMAARQAG